MNRYSAETVNNARQLRRKRLSFQEIGRRLSIPSTTIRNWCYDLGIDRHESLRLNNEIRRQEIRDLDNSIVPDKSLLSLEQARLLASLLYACEGCKYPAYNVVSFVNSDPKLVKVFIELLRKGFDLDESRFRVHLQVHDYHNFNELRDFWSRELSLKSDQFIKPTVTSPRGKMHRRNYLGTATLRYLDNKIQLRLLGIFDRFVAV